MTTPIAERLYLAQHESQWQGKPYAVFNPDNLPEGDLPIIYGFNNGGRKHMLHAVLIAEDGEELGGHCCSDEGYMRSDLGIYEGSRPDRHETFREKYPKGYRMTFVPYEEAGDHEGLNAAFNKKKEREEATPKTDPAV